MKKIVIIGASDFQNPLILKAKEMGFETHVFAWKEGAVGEKNADYFYPISVVEKEIILKECERIKPDAITTIGSDLAMITVQYVAEQLKLPCNSSASILCSTNKFLMRESFKKAGIATPQYVIVGEEWNRKEVECISFPVIVKPTDRSGSRGITKVYCMDEIDEAINNAIEYSFEKKAIVEEYIEGDEYSFESISYDGVHVNLAITKKFTTGSPNYIEIGHIEPSGVEMCIKEKAQKEIFGALDALQIKYGASHAEFKVDSQGNVHIIEIGARMGGDCIGSDLVFLSTGYDYMKMVIQVALGDKPQIVQEKEKSVAVIRFILNQRDFENLKEIQEEYEEKIVFLSSMEVDFTSKVIDSGSRHGYYILQCKSIQEAEFLAKLGEK